ncbi:hypothetical protein [Pseudomonas sp. AP3_22 TE3818]
MEGINPSIWFPVVTLVVGVFLKAVFDAWTDNRKVAVERESRVEKRKEIILLQRIDLQRKALGDLQIALADMMRSSNLNYMHDLKAFRETNVWGLTEMSEELSERVRNHFRAVTLMRVRVSDQEVRESSGKLSSTCSRMTLVLSKEEADRLLDVATVEYSAINEKVGAALRALEHEEQALLV